MLGLKGCATTTQQTFYFSRGVCTQDLWCASRGQRTPLRSWFSPPIIWVTRLGSEQLYQLSLLPSPQTVDEDGTYSFMAYWGIRYDT